MTIKNDVLLFGVRSSVAFTSYCSIYAVIYVRCDEELQLNWISYTTNDYMCIELNVYTYRKMPSMSTF